MAPLKDACFMKDMTTMFRSQNLLTLVISIDIILVCFQTYRATFIMTRRFFFRLEWEIFCRTRTASGSNVFHKEKTVKISRLHSPDSTRVWDPPSQEDASDGDHDQEWKRFGHPIHPFTLVVIAIHGLRNGSIRYSSAQVEYSVREQQSPLNIIKKAEHSETVVMNSRLMGLFKSPLLIKGESSGVDATNKFQQNNWSAEVGMVKVENDVIFIKDFDALALESNRSPRAYLLRTGVIWLRNEKWGSFRYKTINHHQLVAICCYRRDCRVTWLMVAPGTSANGPTYYDVGNHGQVLFHGIGSIWSKVCIAKMACYFQILSLSNCTSACRSFGSASQMSLSW